MRNGFVARMAATALGWAAVAGVAFGQAGPPAPGVATVEDPGVVQIEGFGPGPVSGGTFGMPVSPGGTSVPPAPLIAPPINDPTTGQPAFLPTDPIPFPSQGGQPVYPPAPGNPYPEMSFDGQQMLMGQGPGANRNSPFIGWFRGEYLMWFVKDSPMNIPLATTSAPADLGLLGRQTTLPLIGGDVGYNITNGARITAGLWFHNDSRVGVEYSGIFLERDIEKFHYSSSAAGIPLVSRPFTDITTNTPSTQLVAFPNFSNGSINVKVENHIWGSEGNMVLNLFRSAPGGPVHWLINWTGGFRYFQIDERVRVRSNTQLFGGDEVFPVSLPFGGLGIQGPAAFEVTDQFQTLNEFYAGQLGLQTRIRKNKFMLDIGAKVALGNLASRVDVNGFSTLTTQPGQPILNIPPHTSTIPGGLLANVGNIGRYRQNDFAVMPELTVNFGVQWTPHFSTFVGYNVIWLDNVLRPGAQINSNLNPALVPTSSAYGQDGFAGTNPVPLMRETDFWVQGINFGFHWEF